MSWSVEHTCPQCGAPIVFAETDRLLDCRYCRVRSFMVVAHTLRTQIDPRVTGDAVLYAPYLHLRGNVFFQRGDAVAHRHLHVSPLGADSVVLPPSLGWKTQTQRLRVIHPVEGSTFLRFSRKPQRLLDDALAAAVGPGGGLRALIGQTTSVVYFPFVRRGGLLVDGVTGDPLARMPPGASFGEHALAHAPRPELHFLGTLCPRCGLPLRGEAASVALTCASCESAWEPEGHGSQAHFVRRGVATVHTRGGSYVYLPFWRLPLVPEQVPGGGDGARAAPALAFDTCGTFARLTGQRVLSRKADDAPMVFYAPAFKVRPHAQLRMSARLTLAQREFDARADVPRAHHYPVSLSSREAARTIALTVGELAFHKRDVLPRLAHARPNVGEPSLLYLPFRQHGPQLVEPHLQIGIEPRALEHARQL